MIKCINKSCGENSSKTVDGVNPLICRLLCSRGINTEKKIKSFLYDGLNELSSPFGLSGMRAAADKIKSAISDNKEITLYGDYDCDGIGGVAILYLTLKKLGADVNYYIPTRHDEGYGLNTDAINRIKNTVSPDLIITVDCGISSAKEVKYAISLGMDVIVTDHHTVGEILPEAVIVNPQLNPEYTPLCGAGVAMKLSEALTSRKEAEEYLDICALSTIADIVPLVGDNRIYAKYGLQKLSKNPRLGLKKLILESKLTGNVDSYDVGFKLAPKLNAAGRLSTATKSLQLLLEDDATAVSLLVAELIKENENRQRLCEEVISDAKEMLKTVDLTAAYIIILYKKDWEEGVIGISAAKIAETFKRPTILLTGETEIVKGSARSIAGVNIIEILNNCKERFIKYGGHAMAAGLSLKKTEVGRLIAQANDYVEKNCDLEAFSHCVNYDEELNLDEIDVSLAEELDMLAPFGYHNPRPVFLTKISAYPFLQIGNYPHIKASIKHGEIVAFNRVEALSLLKSDSKKLATFTVEKACYKNREYVQAKLKDLCVEKADLDEKELKEKYLGYFLMKTEKQPASIKKSYCENKLNSGILYITFSLPKAEEILNKFNGNIDLAVYNDYNSNPYTRVALAPNEGFDFSYYSKLVFIETPPSAYLKKIRSDFCGEIEYEANAYPNFSPYAALSVDRLREIFVFIKNNLNCVPFFDAERLYKVSLIKGCKFSYDEFFVSLYVFFELTLITVSEYGIININNKKVDLAQSKILAFVNKK